MSTRRGSPLVRRRRPALFGSSAATGPRDWNLETNPTAWWQASSLLTVYADGDLAAGWNSSNPPSFYSATSPVVANRAIYRTAGLGGLPALDFDAAGDRLSANYLTLMTDLVGVGSYCAVAILHVDSAHAFPGNAFLSDPVWMFEGGYAGVYVSQNGGLFTVYADQFTAGGHKTASLALGASPPAIWVVHSRYDAIAQTLTVGVNGVEGAPTPGVLPATQGSNLLFAFNDLSGVSLDCNLGEVMFKKDATLPLAFINASMADYGL